MSWTAFIGEFGKSATSRMQIARYEGGSAGDYIKVFANPIPGHMQKSVAEREAERLGKDLVEPTYSIPTAEEEAMQLARNRAGNRLMAGEIQAREKIDTGIASSTQDVMRSSTSSQEALGALTSINANGMSANNDLSYASARNYDERLSGLGNMLQNYAGYQDLMWNTNVYDKFKRDAAAISALKNADLHNKRNDANDSSTAALYATNQYMGNRQQQNTNNGSMAGGAQNAGSYLGNWNTAPSNTTNNNYYASGYGNIMTDTPYTGQQVTPNNQYYAWN